MDRHPLKHIIEAALLTAGRPLSMQHLQQLLGEDDETPLAKEFVQSGLDALSEDLHGRGIELKLVSSGYRLQVRQSLEPWIARLFEERPPRYSRALLETLALIGYRQPITRAEIEDVRGVSVSSNIIRTLLEREWVKVVGHRDVPGRPSMYGTTKQFLDYFNLKSLSELPELGELMDLDKASEEFDKANGGAANDGDNSEEGEENEQPENAEPSDTELADSDGTAESAEALDDVEREVAAEQAVETSAVPSNDMSIESISDESEQIKDADIGSNHLDKPSAAQEQLTTDDADAELDDQHSDGEAQEDIDADVESLIRMLDAEAGGDTTGGAPTPGTVPSLPAEADMPALETEAAAVEADECTQNSPSQSSQHEAARGESITPADLLRRHSTDVES